MFILGITCEAYSYSLGLSHAANTTTVVAARRGVRALEVLPSGNLVLLDEKNGTVWQSFDHPSEVLLPGQKLYVGSSLVSSVSTSDRSPGTYSLVVELDGVYLYASSAVGGPQPYYGPGTGGRRGVLRFFSSINGSREQFTRNGSDCFNLISISVEYDHELNSSLTLRESWNLSRCNISAAVFNTSKPLSLDTFGSPFGECTALLIGCYLRLDPDGDIRQYQPRVPRTGMVWSSVEGDLLKTSVNSTSCFLPNECGPYGVCGDGGCRCPGASASTRTPPQAFFQYIDPAMPQLGCTRSTPLNTCGSNVSSNSSNARTVLLEVDDVGFFAVGNNRFLVPRDKNVSLEVCKQGCLRNCTCQVLLFTDREVETLCYYAPGLSYGLRNNSVSGGATGNGTGVVRAFFKVLELPQVTDPGTVVMPSTAKHSVTKLAGVISSGVFVLLVLIFVLALYLFHKRRLKVYKSSKEEMLLTALSGLPPKVSYKELKAATSNFGRRLGSGEQGDVYEAVVLDGSKVAVKQLELGPLVQNEFHDQVATLARIQHYNLVRLRGYCAEGAHLHLVYELVPNGSLDTWLFWRPPLEAVVAAAAVETNEAGSNGEEAASTTEQQQQQRQLQQQQQQQEAKGRPLLPWNVRFNISLGIARGLLHLHEGCSEQVLHLALKPQSILLDANMNPKISGYGLSKLKKTDERQQQPPSSRRVQRESRARGYQAPEWLLHAPASPEMDVYSFGMILLEIISGRRNLDVAYGSEQAFFPSWACEQVELGRQMLLVDSRLADAVDPEQAEKLIHIALWCIQEVPKLRPRMRFVVEMLEGQERVPKAPSSLHVVLHNTGGLFKELGAGFSMEKLDLANFDQNSDAYDRELELSDVELLMSRERSDTCAR